MAGNTLATCARTVLASESKLMPDLEALYKDIHAHPELSMHETRTAGIAADRLERAGYEVTTGVGKTGVVGLLRNGDGPRSCCAPTWMRCRLPRKPDSPMRAR